MACPIPTTSNLIPLCMIFAEYICQTEVSQISPLVHELRIITSTNPRAEHCLLLEKNTHRFAAVD